MFMTVGSTCESMQKVLENNDLEMVKELAKLITVVAPQMQALAKDTEYETFVTTGFQFFTQLQKALEDNNIELVRSQLRAMMSLGNAAAPTFMKLVEQSK
jgi:hypothetical protein